jgi:ribosomal-protein-alanine N-acetyltransferase
VDRTPIGETSFHGPPDESGTVEVGYSIVPDYRGQGFALEATRALIDEAFARPDVCRITAACLDDNVASLKVLERLGMRLVGATGETLRFELRKDTAKNSQNPADP